MIKIFTILLIACGITFAQISTEFGSGNPVYSRESTTIPFEMRGHKIYLKVHINHSSRPFLFILDTGAFTSIDRRTMQELGLSRGNSLQIGGEIRYAYFLQEEVSLQVGDAGAEKFRLVCLDYSHFHQSDPELEGFLGSNFLRFFYVKIDYRQRQLVLSRYPFSIPSDSRTYRLPLDTRNLAYLPRIQCRIDNRWSWNGLIDSGAPFAIVFPLSTLDQQRRSSAPLIESIGAMAQWPTSRIDKNYLSRVEQLRLGEMEFSHVPVLFANTEDIILGEEFLSQFVLYLHYPANEVIFVNQGNTRLRENFYSAGIKLGKTADQRTVVEAIWKGSAADQAGLSVNMEVLRLNGQITGHLSLSDITQLLNNDRIPSVELLIKEGYGERSYQLKKAPLLPAPR